MRGLGIAHRLNVKHNHSPTRSPGFRVRPYPRVSFLLGILGKRVQPGAPLPTLLQRKTSIGILYTHRAKRTALPIGKAGLMPVSVHLRGRAGAQVRFRRSELSPRPGIPARKFAYLLNLQRIHGAHRQCRRTTDPGIADRLARSRPRNNALQELQIRRRAFRLSRSLLRRHPYPQHPTLHIPGNLCVPCKSHRTKVFARQHPSAAASTKSSCSPSRQLPYESCPAADTFTCIPINSFTNFSVSGIPPAISTSPASNITCNPKIKSRFCTRHAVPTRAAASPPVIVTATTGQPNRAARSKSTTGAPTPVASTTSSHRPRSAGLCTTSLVVVRFFNASGEHQQDHN